MRRKIRRARGVSLPRKYILLGAVILMVGLFMWSYYRFDRRILPLVLDEAELNMQTEINNVINRVIHDLIVENRITAQDFIVQVAAAPDALPAINVNTVLVNEFSNAVAQAMSHYLANMPPTRVRVPLGMATGLDTLAQRGPRFSFNLAPVGNALVDHDSQFSAVGINQVHFSVWLNVDAVVRIINPHESREIAVSRQISLVDTVIAGVVPEMYLHGPVMGFGN